MKPPVYQPSIDALAELAALPNTEVGILSGRSIAQLDVVCPLGHPVFRVGSHGAEVEGEPLRLSDADRAALRAAEEALAPLVEDHPGSFVEIKPYQRVFHFARADEEHVASAQARSEAIEVPGLVKHTGRRVTEFSASTTTKGEWLREALSSTHPADAALFIGDDTTDETGFRALRELADPLFAGVRVGDGDTAAPYRVADLEGVGELLRTLATLRATHIASLQA